MILISTITSGQSESQKKRKSVYLEIAGSGGLGSINYEKCFLKKNYTEYTWRAGISFMPIAKRAGTAIVFPLMINSIIGKNSHKLDLSLGQGLTLTTKGNFFILTTAAFGYRYQSENKNWFYRIAYTPLISYIYNFQVQQWGGITIGCTINNPKK